jgi:2-oxoglutarate dehydrogenase E2 component (dihydrolipoamide succinyltransferase)
MSTARSRGDHGQRRRAGDRAAAHIRAARHPARPDAAQDRREHGPRGQRGAARHRAVRSRFLRDRRAQGGAGAKGVKLSYTAYIVKAAAEAMAVAPAINGRWERTASPSRRRSTSASAPRSARRGWSCRWSRTPALSARGDRRQARRPHPPRPRRQLTGGDVSGGSFTISNHGVSGSLLAAPIILHQGRRRDPRRRQAREARRGARGRRRGRDPHPPMAYVTLTIDHRVVDGHQTNAWLTASST